MRKRLASERGFTIIETLMAAVVTAIGVMAMMATLDGSRRIVDSAERNETATHEAQQELERIQSMPFDEVGTTSAPGTSSDEEDPRFWVRAGGTYRWKHDSSSQDEQLVTGGGSTLPLTSDWSDGENRLSGEIWRFVTQVPGEPKLKRVTVAATLDGDDAPTEPILLSTIVADLEPDSP